MAGDVGYSPEETEEIKGEILNLIVNSDALTFYGAIQTLGPRAPKKTTLYEWRKADPEWDAAIDEAQNAAELSVTALARHKAVEAINAGDGKMVRFWLERREKAKFALRTEMTGPNGTALRNAKIEPTNLEEANEAMQTMLEHSQGGGE